MNQEGLDDRWEDVFVAQGDGCWEWRGARQSAGYGFKRTGGRQFLTHRLSFELRYGRKPVGVVRHTCDNRKCYRPSHLIEGSRADNSRDMIERDRSRHGARSANAKLSGREAREIRDLYDSKVMMVKDIAALYGVSRQNVTHIGRRTGWTNPRSFSE